MTPRTISRLDPRLSEIGSLKDIAEGIGITGQALYNLRRVYDDFPEPLRWFGITAVYAIDEVEAFHREVGRGYGAVSGRQEGVRT